MVVVVLPSLDTYDNTLLVRFSDRRLSFKLGPSLDHLLQHYPEEFAQKPLTSSFTLPAKCGEYYLDYGPWGYSAYPLKVNSVFDNGRWKRNVMLNAPENTLEVRLKVSAYSYLSWTLTKNKFLL